MASRHQRRAAAAAQRLESQKAVEAPIQQICRGFGWKPRSEGDLGRGFRQRRGGTAAAPRRPSRAAGLTKGGGSKASCFYRPICCFLAPRRLADSLALAKCNLTVRTPVTTDRYRRLARRQSPFCRRVAPSVRLAARLRLRQGRGAAQQRRRRRPAGVFQLRLP
jgi:hypothetical protein